MSSSVVSSHLTGFRSMFIVYQYRYSGQLSVGRIGDGVRADRHPDPVGRKFIAAAPDQLWVTDPDLVAT